MIRGDEHRVLYKLDSNGCLKHMRFVFVLMEEGGGADGDCIAQCACAVY